MKRTQIYMNKLVYLGLPILKRSKNIMYKFWCDYAKLKHGDKTRLCYTDTGGFIVYIKTDGIFKDIPKDVQKRLYTSNYESKRPLPKGKNRNLLV